MCTVAGVCITVWVFIFIGGFVEWCHEIPGKDPGDGHIAAACIDGYDEYGCGECSLGYLQGGRGCFKHLEDLPPVEAGAALGPGFYFVLIVVTQLAGIACEIGLINRVRTILPRKEKAILGTALCIEMVRMLLIDVFVLQDYFGGESYQIFRAPEACDALANNTSTPWLGADSMFHCEPAADDHRGEDAQYYIATHREAFTADAGECSLFTSDTALLDLDETSETWGTGGHPRFSRLGWVIGGEFALYYFFATFINELADCMFVIPTTTAGGWKCKIFSVALEFAQLGALAPAAIFEHGPCLHYTNPLGVSISVIRDIIVPFGYCIWGFILACIPCAVFGAALVCMTGVLGAGCGRCVNCMTGVCVSSCGGGNPNNHPGPGCVVRCGERLEVCRIRLRSCTERVTACWKRFTTSGFEFVLTLAFLPLLLSGIFLGMLVVIGQGSKHGLMNVLTALVLLADVIFKLGATALTEIAEWALHRRVKTAVALREQQAKQLMAHKSKPATGVTSQREGESCAISTEEGEPPVMQMP
jgi:hypothetical protein